jgi:hypothetical protein
MIVILGAEESNDFEEKNLGRRLCFLVIQFCHELSKGYFSSVLP